MDVNGESEAWSEEETNSSMAWAVPHKATNGGFCFRIRDAQKEWDRFYPIVHVARLKKVRDYGKRPNRRLVTGLREADRFNSIKISYQRLVGSQVKRA